MPYSPTPDSKTGKPLHEISVNVLMKSKNSVQYLQSNPLRSIKVGKNVPKVLNRVENRENGKENEKTICNWTNKASSNIKNSSASSKLSSITNLKVLLDVEKKPIHDEDNIQIPSKSLESRKTVCSCNGESNVALYENTETSSNKSRTECVVCEINEKDEPTIHEPFDLVSNVAHLSSGSEDKFYYSEPKSGNIVGQSMNSSSACNLVSVSDSNVTLSNVKDGKDFVSSQVQSSTIEEKKKNCQQDPTNSFVTTKSNVDIQNSELNSSIISFGSDELKLNAQDIITNVDAKNLSLLPFPANNSPVSHMGVNDKSLSSNNSPRNNTLSYCSSIATTLSETKHSAKIHLITQESSPAEYHEQHSSNISTKLLHPCSTQTSSCSSNVQTATPTKYQVAPSNSCIEFTATPVSTFGSFPDTPPSSGSLPQPGSRSVVPDVKLPDHAHQTPTTAVPLSRRNARERNRVRQVSQGFAILRQHVPQAARRKKLSKVETLRCAVDYIKALSRMVYDSEETGSSSSLSSNPTASNNQQQTSNYENFSYSSISADQLYQSAIPVNTNLGSSNEEILTPQTQSEGQGTKLVRLASGEIVPASLDAIIYKMPVLVTDDNSINGSQFDQFERHGQKFYKTEPDISVDPSATPSLPVSCAPTNAAHNLQICALQQMNFHPNLAGSNSSSTSSTPFVECLAQESSSTTTSTRRQINEQLNSSPETPNEYFNADDTDQESELMDCLSLWQETP